MRIGPEITETANMLPVRNLDDVDSLVEIIESTADDTELQSAMDALVGHHKTLNIAIGRSGMYWRARRCGPAGFDLERDIWYPPAGVASHARCSDANEPALYLSGRRETALVELDVQPGDIFHLGGFQIRPGQKLQMARLGDTHHVVLRGNLLLGLPQEAALAITDAINSLPPAVGRLMIYTDAVLAGILGSRSARLDGYRLQRVLLKSLYNKLSSVDGAIYPSTRHELGINLAVRGASADRAIQGCCSFVVEVVKARRHGTFDLKLIKAATDVDAEGAFVWDKSPSEGELYLYRLTVDEAAAGPQSLAHLKKIRSGD